MSVLFVFLGILKIILYLILIILFVILLLLGIVLFVPIKYKAEVDKHEKTYGVLSATWFFTLVRLDCSYEKGKMEMKARALFWTIFGGKNARDKTKKKANQNKTIPPKKVDNKTSQQSIVAERTTEDKGDSKTDTKQNGSTPDDRTDFSHNDNNKKGIISRLRSAYHKIIYMRDYPNRVEIQSLTWGLIKKICKTLKPNVFTLYGEIGFADPSTTGVALGGLYAVSALMGADIRIKGDFEKEVLDLKLFSKGRFILWSIVWPLIRYIYAKPIWKLVRKIIFG